MESRLYCFTNPLYMSQIQVGIQSLHVLSELNIKYRRRLDDYSMELFHDWQNCHKTVIILNGGVHNDLVDIKNTFEVICPSLDLPFAHFNEDEYSLGGILTCVGVVVPEYIYNAVDYNTAMDTFDMSSPNAKTICGDTDKNSFFFQNKQGTIFIYKDDSVMYQFIKLLKSKRLA